MASLNMIQVFDVSLYAETFFRAKPLALVKLETLPNWLGCLRDVYSRYDLRYSDYIKTFSSASLEHFVMFVSVSLNMDGFVQNVIYAVSVNNQLLSVFARAGCDRPKNHIKTRKVVGRYFLLIKKEVLKKGKILISPERKLSFSVAQAAEVFERCSQATRFRKL